MAVNARLAKANGYHVPGSCSWVNTAPSPTGLASTTNSVAFSGSKYAMVASVRRAFFMLSKASCSSGPHVHLAPVLVRALSGSDRLARFGRKCAQYVAMPRKLRISVGFLAVGTSLIAANFLGSTCNPSWEKKNPKNSTLGSKNKHFSLWS